MIEKYK